MWLSWMRVFRSGGVAGLPACPGRYWSRLGWVAGAEGRGWAGGRLEQCVPRVGPGPGGGQVQDESAGGAAARAHLAELRLSAAGEALTGVLDATRTESLSLITSLERLLGIEAHATAARRHAARRGRLQRQGPGVTRSERFRGRRTRCGDR